MIRIKVAQTALLEEPQEQSCASALPQDSGIPLLELSRVKRTREAAAAARVESPHRSGLFI